MSIAIKSEIRKTSKIKYHYDNAPGQRYVFVDKKLFPKSEFYIIGRRIEFVPKGQKDYINIHRHNCNSYYIFIGDNEDLTGLKAEVIIENEKRIIESPCSVLIPEKVLHTYKLIDGKGWFIHIVLNPDYNSSLFDGKIENKINFHTLCKKALRQDKKAKQEERPLSSNIDRITNPQRYIFINPDLYDKPKIYVAIHKIVEDIPFAYNMILHKHETDECYILINRKDEKLRIRLFEPEAEKIVESPSLIYHEKNTFHRYEYVEGGGILLVVFKEKNPGEGYKFIKSE